MVVGKVKDLKNGEPIKSLNENEANVIAMFYSVNVRFR